MKLTEKKASKIYNKCVKLYDKSISSVYEYCNKLGLLYSECEPCEVETPTIATKKYSCCAVCGTSKTK